MVYRPTSDKSLSQAKMVSFADAYKRHSASMSKWLTLDIPTVAF